MQTQKLKYTLVDVFTDRPFAGNQLAVVADARGLSAETMQAITREFNLSETSFVLPPEDPANDFKVRIFTPGREMLMAGHPTVGTGFVLGWKGLVKPTENQKEVAVRFEEGVGPIPVSVTFKGYLPSTVWMTQPLPQFGPTFDDRASMAEVLSLKAEDLDPELPVQIVSCGEPFLYIPLRDLDAAHRARLKYDAWRRVLERSKATGVFLFTREVENEGSTVHSRMFAPDLGVGEDPATGAASGPLGCYLVRHGVVSPEAGTARMLSEQGLEMGRPSFVQIEIDAEGDGITGVRIGGTCRFIGEGYLEVPA